jgi:hypothetical protein
VSNTQDSKLKAADVSGYGCLTAYSTFLTAAFQAVVTQRQAAVVDSAVRELNLVWPVAPVASTVGTTCLYLRTNLQSVVADQGALVPFSVVVVHHVGVRHAALLSLLFLIGGVCMSAYASYT